MKVEIKFNDINNFVGKYIVTKSQKKYVAQYMEVHKNAEGYHLASFKQISKNRYTLPQHGKPIDSKYLLALIGTYVENCQRDGEVVEFHTDINEVWK